MQKRWKNGFCLFLAAAVCQAPFLAVQADTGADGRDQDEPAAAAVSGDQAGTPGAEEAAPAQGPGPGETGSSEGGSLEGRSPEAESGNKAPEKSEHEKDETKKAGSREDRTPKKEIAGYKNGKDDKDTRIKARAGTQGPNEEITGEPLSREASAEDASPQLPQVKPLQKPFEDVLEETRAYILDLDTRPDYSSQWFALGLARGGMDLEDSYFHTFYENMAGYIAAKDGRLHRAKYSEYSKAILSLTAMGIDARRVNGYNLLEYLADLANVKKQGINGPIWALMALKSHPDYAVPEVEGVREQTTEEGLVEYLLEREVKGGGWTMKGDTAEVDITGMAIQALSSYYQKEGYEGVTAAIDRAVAVLSKMQNAKTGGYAIMGADNVESCVQTVVALCSVGIDPRTDERFIKSKNWTVADLVSYHKDGSGFMHVKPGGANNGGAAPGAVDGMATEQGHYGMVAYQRFLDGKTFLYDMSDVTLREGWEVAPLDLGQEETPTPRPSPQPTKTPESGTRAGENVQNPTVPDEGTGGMGTTAAPAPATKTATTKKAAPAASQTIPPQTAGKKTTVSADAGKKEKEREDDGGWDFEGETYMEDPNSWDLAEAAGGDTDAGAAEGDIQAEETKIPPFDRAVAGGIIGAAAFEGFKSVFQRKRGRKDER